MGDRVKTCAYLGGTFDLLHPGHIRFFQWAKMNFDKVVVSLNTDEFVQQYKGVKPTQTFAERREMVEAVQYVDFAVANVGGADSKPAILVVKPTHIVDGSDWTRERLKEQMQLTEEFLGENGLVITLCPLVREYSSTELKERVRRVRTDFVLDDEIHL